jgi:hypothetical protein
MAQLVADYPPLPSSTGRKQKDLHAMPDVSFSMLQIIKRNNKAQEREAKSSSPKGMQPPHSKQLDISSSSRRLAKKGKENPKFQYTTQSQSSPARFQMATNRSCEVH